MSAIIVEITPSATTASITQLTIATSPKKECSHPLSAARTALTTSDTSSRNPSERIIATDSRRVRTTPQMPRFGFGSTFQTVSSAPCSSMTTPVAPASNATKPMIVPSTPPFVWLALATAAWMSWAASGPTTPASWPNMLPSAACRPNTRPAIETTSSSNGASENTV